MWVFIIETLSGHLSTEKSIMFKNYVSGRSVGITKNIISILNIFRFGGTLHVVNCILQLQY